jgi:hypothetical protein
MHHVLLLLFVLESLLLLPHKLFSSYNVPDERPLSLTQRTTLIAFETNGVFRLINLHANAVVGTDGRVSHSVDETKVFVNVDVKD